MSAEARNQWGLPVAPWPPISVHEGYPRDHQHVLAWITGGSLHHGEDFWDIAMYLNGVFRMFNGDYDEPVPVSYWLPLPPSPVINGKVKA